MDLKPRSCFLRCLLDSHAPIKLKHNVETIIGRNKITKIKDQSCSRQQLSLKADCEAYLVQVKQLGVNPSGLNGFSLTKNGIYKVEHGSRIEILINNYPHIIEFDPPPQGYGKPIVAKRSVEDDSIQPSSKKSNVESEEDEVVDIKPCQEDHWDNIDDGELYVFTSKGVKSSTKIAAFDMDGTLIKTKSSKVHPVNTEDWQIALPNIEKKLKQLLQDEFKLVILSNQAAIGNGRVKIEDFEKKIEAIVKTLDVPFQVYIAAGKGIYRKPYIGMWSVLTKEKNDGLEIDKNLSFYCGDAAGRLAKWAPGKKKDHSLADILMAENIGIKFYTPEEFFLGHSIANVPMAKPQFDPKYIQTGVFNHSLICEDKEILVFVGYPGSGKSFLAQQIKEKSGLRYEIVSRDELGTWQKCAAEAKNYLQRGKSVIVDSTNPDKESRGRWITLAQQMKVDCRCAYMTISMAHAQHNNRFRELMKFKHLPVNEIVYHTYKNKFVEPAFSEGFREIIHTEFQPCFKNKEHEIVYRMHLLEK